MSCGRCSAIVMVILEVSRYVHYKLVNTQLMTLGRRPKYVWVLVLVIGICIGTGVGIVVGVGICIGISVGACIGIGVGIGSIS